jgi:hypothetical protein
MFAKLVFIEIAQDRHFPACVGPSDFRQLVQCEAQDAYAGPAATGAGQHLSLCASFLSEGPIRICDGGRSTTRPIGLPANFSLERSGHRQSPCAVY